MLQFIKSKVKAITSALTKTASFFRKRLSSIFSKKLDEEQMEMLEELLYEADLGSKVIEQFVEKVEAFYQKSPDAKADEFIQVLEKTAEDILSKSIPNLSKEAKPGHAKVIIVAGVNGSGKTTSIAKLAKLYVDDKKKVLLACGDTFRAAAVEQLEIHAKNLGVDIVLSKQGADPAAVIYEAMEKSKDGYDIVICDTAGRLESKEGLLEELKKMTLVATKIDKDAPHDVFLTIDAGLGQTCLNQVEKFNEATNITGLILTKIDSTSKGGVALSIYKNYEIPIKYVGYGETLCDFSLFEAKSYAKALFKE